MIKNCITKIGVSFLIICVLGGCAMPLSKKEKTTAEFENEYIDAIGELCNHLMLTDEYDKIIEYYPKLLTSSGKMKLFEEINTHDNITPEITNNAFWFQLMVAIIRSDKVSDVTKNPSTYCDWFCGGNENNYIAILGYIDVADLNNSEVEQLINILYSFTTISGPKEQVMIFEFIAQLYTDIGMEKKAEEMRDKAQEIVL